MPIIVPGPQEEEPRASWLSLFVPRPAKLKAVFSFLVLAGCALAPYLAEALPPNWPSGLNPAFPRPLWEDPCYELLLRSLASKSGKDLGKGTLFFVNETHFIAFSPRAGKIQTRPLDSVSRICDRYLENPYVEDVLYIHP